MGARIIKTGIAVTITMFILKALNLEPAIFGAISAVINLQPSIFLTFKTAKDQILVHVLGVGTALIFGYLHGGECPIHGAYHHFAHLFIHQIKFTQRAHNGNCRCLIRVERKLGTVLAASPNQIGRDFYRPQYGDDH